MLAAWSRLLCRITEKRIMDMYGSAKDDSQGGFLLHWKSTLGKSKEDEDSL